MSIFPWNSLTNAVSPDSSDDSEDTSTVQCAVLTPKREERARNSGLAGRTSKIATDALASAAKGAAGHQCCATGKGKLLALLVFVGKFQWAVSLCWSLLVGEGDCWAGC